MSMITRTGPPSYFNKTRGKVVRGLKKNTDIKKKPKKSKVI